MGNQPYSNIKCPECEKIGDYVNDDNDEVYCSHCGLVIKTSYPYTAGIRFKTLTEILEDERNEEKRRRFYGRIKKFQKV